MFLDSVIFQPGNKNKAYTGHFRGLCLAHYTDTVKLFLHDFKWLGLCQKLHLG